MTVREAIYKLSILPLEYHDLPLIYWDDAYGVCEVSAFYKLKDQDVIDIEGEVVIK